jgi:hypothetical protein
MKRAIHFAASLVVALTLVTFLPLYVERTMTHVMFAHGTGTIEWGWKRCSFSEFWSVRPYIRPEQEPALWLAVNVALAVTYALLRTFVIDQFLSRNESRTVRDGTKV